MLLPPRQVASETEAAAARQGSLLAFVLLSKMNSSDRGQRQALFEKRSSLLASVGEVAGVVD